jgi:hypothetical protein
VKKILVLFVLILLMQQSYSSGFKKYAAEFLNSGVGSRALSMGGAFSAVANDVTAGYWNPSGLVNAKGFQVQFMHAKQYTSSVQYDYFAASNLFDTETALGFSLIRLGVDDIKNSRNALLGDLISDGLDYSKITSFNVADYAFFLSYAKRYNEQLSYGANVKLIYRDFDSESALGIGFDVGAQYAVTQNFLLGMTFRDITTTMMAWSTSEKEFIPPSLRPGLSYRYDIESIDLYLQPAVDLNILFEGRKYAAQFNLGPVSFDTFWGAEIGFKDLIFLRLGYDDLNRFNGGVGFSITKLAVDYSYMNYDRELGNVHRISFHLKLDAF